MVRRQLALAHIIQSLFFFVAVTAVRVVASLRSVTSLHVDCRSLGLLD